MNKKIIAVLAGIAAALGILLLLRSLFNKEEPSPVLEPDSLDDEEYYEPAPDILSDIADDLA